MPATFIADLQAKIAAFEATLGPTADAVSEHVEATAEIAAAIRRIMVARRILDGVMRNVLAANTVSNDGGKNPSVVFARRAEKLCFSGKALRRFRGFAAAFAQQLRA